MRWRIRVTVGTVVLKNGRMPFRRYLAPDSGGHESSSTPTEQVGEQSRVDRSPLRDFFLAFSPESVRWTRTPAAQSLRLLRCFGRT